MIQSLNEPSHGYHRVLLPAHYRWTSCTFPVISRHTTSPLIPLDPLLTLPWSTLSPLASLACPQRLNPPPTCPTRTHKVCIWFIVAAKQLWHLVKVRHKKSAFWFGSTWEVNPGKSHVHDPLLNPKLHRGSLAFENALRCDDIDSISS